MNIRITGHCFHRMFERGIPVAAVLEAVETGTMIEEYPDDTPFPSRLQLLWKNGKPLHVVSSIDPGTGTVYLITAYYPDEAVWDASCTRRKTQ